MANGDIGKDHAILVVYHLPGIGRRETTMTTVGRHISTTGGTQEI
jgi:hypothetical protein